jgi:hypothetical protein
VPVSIAAIVAKVGYATKSSGSGSRTAEYSKIGNGDWSVPRSTAKELVDTLTAERNEYELVERTRPEEQIDHE